MTPLPVSTAFKTQEQITHDERLEAHVTRIAEFCVAFGGHLIDERKRTCVHCGLSDRDILARGGRLK